MIEVTEMVDREVKQQSDTDQRKARDYV